MYCHVLPCTAMCYFKVRNRTYLGLYVLLVICLKLSVPGMYWYVQPCENLPKVRTGKYTIRVQGARWSRYVQVRTSTSTYRHTRVYDRIPDDDAKIYLKYLPVRTKKNTRRYALVLTGTYRHKAGVQPGSPQWLGGWHWHWLHRLRLNQFQNPIENDVLNSERPQRFGLV